MADIKNITFDSQSKYQHLTFTSYSSSISGNNWVIDSTFTVKCDSGTSIGPSGTNRRGFTGTINGQKVILHHPKGRVGPNLYNVVGVTQAQHLEIHGFIGYKNADWGKAIYILGKGEF